jgi:hypothetical protein
MRRWIAAFALLVLVAVAGAAAIGASAADRADRRAATLGALAPDGATSGAARAPRGAERIVLVERGGQFTFVDTDQSGDESVGDMILGNPRLENRGGHTVGRLRFTCQLNFGETLQCQATATLFGRGTIEIAGTFTPRNDRLAVTGGTGEFADAGGEVRVADRDEFLILHLGG